MKKRTLGQNLEVSAIGFGCMGLNFGYASSLTKEEGIKLIRAPVERGVIGLTGAMSNATKLHRLEENLAAAEVELTPNDLIEIERTAAEIEVQGERYPEHLL
ncbi:MAG TPA: hypothetical protein VKB08_09735, partial [Bradyrhizobium sp.]|nr:hypothetical protein [Bradyrhizobium sp.]